jgi:peptidoglycan/LPS O-acetylase OafA/YrhL
VRRETSIYLNAVRFFAALAVFLGHVSGRRFTDGLLWPFAEYMDIAVIIFFVLSGYVIAYVTDKRERTLDSYSINRIARILSVALPALALTFVLDTIGRQLHPEYYSAAWGYSSDRIWLQYLTGLTFTNELWSNHINVGSMLPYWSLGFEVWYYAIFAAFWFLRGKARIILTAILCLIAGPKILFLFPIWIGGFAVYHVGKHRALTQGWALCIFTVTFAVPLVLFAMTSLVNLRLKTSYLELYLAAAMFLLNILAIQNVSAHFGGVLRGLERPIGWLAGMTFSLYLYHLPVAQFLTTLVPWAPHDIRTRVIMMVGTFIIIAALAEVTERRKNAWRDGIAKWFDRFGMMRRAFRPTSP